MIHVAYGLHDKTGHYSKFVGTSMLSLFENHSCPPRSITVHLLHDNTLTLDNYEKFVYLAGQYNQIIKFYNVEKLFPEEIDKLRNSFTADSLKLFSVMSTCKLILGQVVSKEIDKIISLDADTVINLDIKELWQVELGDSPLGAVTELIRQHPMVKEEIIVPEDYFNAGIMVLNLDFLRMNYGLLMDGLKFTTEKKYPYVEQDVFNYCFSKQYIKLPEKFNTHVRAQPRFSNTPLERKIYHYLGKSDSLNMDMRDKFNRLWFSYFLKTPWFNEDTIGNLYNGVIEIYSRIYAEQKNLMTQVSAIMSGKRRAFVTFPQNVDSLKQIFYVQEGEDIFQINSQNWLNELANAMKESVGKKIYFMLTGGIYPQLRAALMQVGFVEGRDFINGEMFLSELHGVKFNSYQLIANM